MKCFREGMIGKNRKILGKTQKKIQKKYKKLVGSGAGTYLCNPNVKIGFWLCLNESELNYNLTTTIW
jgi:hypothetical protein